MTGPARDGPLKRPIVWLSRRTPGPARVYGEDLFPLRLGAGLTGHEVSATDSPSVSAAFDPRLLDLIGEVRCRSFAALHADSSKRPLIDVLRQIHD